MTVSEKDLQDARQRFAAILNAERAKLGLPPQAPEVVIAPKDEYMERWKTQGGGDQTAAFIRLNEERLARGEPALNSRGEPIGTAKPLDLPAMPQVVPEDDFFSDNGGPKIARRG